MSVTLSLLVYLDTNVYSRSFDDQTNEKIRAETNAFLKIIAEVKAGKLRLLCSDILKLETDEILDEEKRATIVRSLELCKEHVDESEEVLQLGQIVQTRCHVRARDALHVASAIIGKARYLLSCDEKVAQKKQANCYRRFAKNYNRGYFSVMNPTKFVEKLSKGKIT
jgi:predicted nucleic acid-binding protein